MNSSDLEQIIKASSNSERLVIKYSDVHLSSALDLTTESEYNINSLSFFNWGYSSNRKSDFISNPSLFENIVKAIGESGLKKSLRTLNIGGCQLDKSVIQEMLDKYELSNIDITYKRVEPLTK